MTENLTERLRYRLESQTAQIESMTAAELRKLVKNLESECEAALTTTANNIRATSQELDGSLQSLRTFGKWLWPALILTWCVIGGYLTWRYFNPPKLGIEAYQSFVFSPDGNRYLMLPEGIDTLKCYQNDVERRCVILPSGI